MTTNREVLQRDPVTTTIPNLGVAKLGMPTSQDEWDVLRYELTSFVCEGEYQKGLEKVLGTFVGRLGHGQQPAAWVSGFYGSGKSHFVRVLDALWRDIEFPDGARARGLVTLPADLQANLKELTTAGSREGGLWSASGTLSSGAGTSVRLAMLNVIFESAGLPVDYAPAKFVIWLKKEGIYEPLRAAVESRGRDLRAVLADMYVSKPLAEALLEVDPTLASSVQEVHGLLMRQYPPTKDELTGDEFVSALEDVMRLRSSVAGKLPLTLLVFDEMQQFLAGEIKRILEVQEIVQDCSARFGSRVLFVATGQAQLTASSDLQRLQDRFSVKVMLDDRDVEKVVREVVLRKVPSKVPELEQALERVSGEIGRHLGGSRIAANGADKPDLIPDYPLLPTRRRFWEHALKAIDHAGTKGQLRAQLSIVHDATKDVADRPLGWVIPADALYWNLEPHMQASGVLPRDTAAIIRERDDGTADGKLMSRVCALVFLIGKLDTEGVGTSGVKPTVDTLADLLVEDLNTGSSSLRQRLPQLLDALAGRGLVMDVGGGEYRLQTKESAEWEADYRRHQTGIRNESARIADLRAGELRTAVNEALKDVRPLQGLGKVPRKADFHFGQDAPPTNTGGIPIWVRDGWNTTESSVQADARAAGVDSPIVFVFLPRLNDNAIADAIASRAAADTTVTTRPTPTTTEGGEAKAAMVSRARTESEKLKVRLADVLSGARVYQGGGNEIAEGSLLASVRRAANDAMARLYTKFSMADNAGWAKVREKAHEGVPDAMSFVGHKGDADQHPVCQEVRSFVGPSGKRGQDVRKHFMAPPYGWSQDAVDGALYALLAGGFLRATLNASPVEAKQLAQNQAGTAEFRSEQVVIQLPQRLEVRGLASDIGLPIKNNEELAAVPTILERLRTEAAQAGGPAPLPEPPSPAMLRDLADLSGNEQFVAVAEKRAELASLHRTWAALEQAKNLRMPRWDQLQRLLRHAEALTIAGELRPQADAILTNRSLLADPDPVAPLVQQLTDALRTELTARRTRLVDEQAARIAELEGSPEWSQLAAPDREAIKASCGLQSVAELQVADVGAVLATLDASPLDEWEDKLLALPGRLSKAREMAARKSTPTAEKVLVKSATLNNATDVEAYLADLRAAIMRHIEAGKPVII